MTYTLRLRSYLAAGASVVAFAAISTFAYAADEPAQATAKGNTVEEVVVTAEKRSVSLQQVPIAVTAFTSKERALIGINSVQDMTNFTPGLTYSSQLDRPVIRGLSRSTNVYLADSAVGVYDNDLFTNSSYLAGRDDMLVEQVEVLSGPQNTLYGRNSIGGVINTKSRRPTESFSGELRAAVGSYQYHKLAGTISGPIAENLTGRLSFFRLDQDRGYYKNLAGKSLGEVHHDNYGELQLQYKGAKDELWFMAYDQSFNNNRGGPGSLLGMPTIGALDVTAQGTGLFFNPNGAYGTDIIAGSAVGKNATSANPSTLKNRTVSVQQPTTIKLRASYSLNFHWTHHFDGVDMKYVGGYSEYHYVLNQYDFTNGQSSVTSYKLPLYTPANSATPVCVYLGAACSPLTVDTRTNFMFEAHPKWYSNEVTFTSTGNGKLSWVAGAYHYDEQTDNPFTTSSSQSALQTGSTWNVITLNNVLGAPSAQFPSASSTQEVLYYLGLLGVPAYKGMPQPTRAIQNPAQSGNLIFASYQSHSNTTAAFAQADYKVTDTIKVTAGLRYSYDLKSAHEETRYIKMNSSNLAGILGSLTPAADITSVLISTAPGKGIAGPVIYATTGKYAGDATRYLRGHSDATTGTLAVNYTPDRDTLAYARYSRGYKAFALNAGYIGEGVYAEPESLDDYEMGLKKSFFDRSLTVDVAAFHYDYKNNQVPLGSPSYTGQDGISGPSALKATYINLNRFINIPTATSDGIELSMRWTPVRKLNLSMIYGYNKTEITTACKPPVPNAGGLIATSSTSCFIDPADPLAIAAGAQPRGKTLATYSQYPGTVANGNVASADYNDQIQSVEGNPLPQTPKNKFAINANYTMEFEPGNLTVSGSYIWKDKSYANIFARSYNEAPAWSQVDLRSTWTSNKGNYELVAYVKNLFDQIGYEAAAGGGYVRNPAGGTTLPYVNNKTLNLTAPRLIGAEVHYHF